MQRQQIKAFLDGYYADRVRNEEAMLLKYVNPNMAYVMAGSADDAPVVATGQGPATIDDIARAMVAAWKWRKVDIRSMLIDGDSAAVHFRLKVEYAPTRETVEMDVGNFFTFRGDMCARLVEFADTAMIRRLAAY